MVTLGAVVGLVNVFFFSVDGAKEKVLSALLIFICGFVFWAAGRSIGVEAFGAGDIKLLAIFPFFVPIKVVLYLFGLSILLAFIFCLYYDMLYNISWVFI